MKPVSIAVYIYMCHTFDTAGNTDGIYKGKKYFDCPPGHGRMVRITSIIAAMPYKVMCINVILYFNYYYYNHRV